MNFFTTLSGTGIKDVVIQAKQDATGNITVFVTPKTIAEDSALKGLKPLHLTGTPEELDAEFFGLVTTPLVQTQNIFNNVEAYEAQMREVSKATADKKAEKDAAAKAKKDASITDGEEKATPAEKPLKVNNEKELKDFMASIKGQDIFLSKDKIEELYATLSETELAKPFAKKVRMDLDIAIRKDANIKAAKEKIYGKKEEEVATPEETKTASNIEVIEEPAVLQSDSDADFSEAMTEQVSDEPEYVAPVIEEKKATDAPTLLKEAVMEVVKEVPNVEPATTPIPVEAPSTPEVKQASQAIPPKPTPTVPQYEEVMEFTMIATDFTREEYHSVGWTDEILVQEGKAHYVPVMKEIVPETKKLSYTFPKEFDAPE